MPQWADTYTYTTVVFNNGYTTQTVLSRQVHHSGLRGFYNIATNTCYVICDDPRHLSSENWYTLMHEWAHRDDSQNYNGVDGESPMWDALARVAPGHMTHEDINLKVLFRSILHVPTVIPP